MKTTAPKKQKSLKRKINAAIIEDMENYSGITAPTLAIFATDQELLDNATAEQKAEANAYARRQTA